MSTKARRSRKAAAPLFRWEALHATSRQFAWSCLRDYSVQDAAFVYLHAGASVELGIKAALCKISPMLLMETGKRDDHRALLRFAGLEPVQAPTRGGREIFTLGFDAAIARFKMLHGDRSLGVTKAELDQLKAARDVTAHAGDVRGAEDGTLLAVLVTLCKVHSALSVHLEETPRAFWGEHLSLVEKVMREGDDNLKAQVDALIAAAERRFHRDTANLDEDTIGQVLMQREDRFEPPDGQSRRKCPACGGTGASHERPAKRTIASRRKSRVERGWLAVDFHCPVCELTLSTEAMLGHAAGFESWMSAEDEMMLYFWAEDMGDDLDAEDIEDLGLAEPDLPGARWASSWPDTPEDD